MLEVLGTAAGGLAFTFLLIPFFHSFQIGLGVCALNFLVCLPLSLLSEHLRPQRRGILGLLLTGLSGSLVLLACGGADVLHWSSIRRQWSPLEVLYYESSPYGNIAVTFRGEQYAFYSDGIPWITLPTPDIASAEEFAHFPLLCHPDPREVLVIGGGAGGLLHEIAKHPVRRIEYAELDPLIFVALEAFCPASLQAEWKTPLVSLQLTDGRRHLRRQAPGKRFDLILIGVSQPSDLQTNRLFTLEFFQLCRERLNPGGIVAFSLPGSLTYLSRELEELNACLLQTLKRSFKYVQVLPGETNLFLASQEIDLASIAAQSLRGEFSSRGLKTSMVNPFYIDYRLRMERRLWLLQSLEDSAARLNRDFQPAAVFYSLGLWNAQFSPRLQKIFRRLGSLTLLPFLIASLVILAALLAYRYFARRPRTSPALVAAIHLTGLCGMMFDLAMVFAFQVFHGYLYQRLGILITAFMAGSGLGAAWITSRLDRLKKTLRLFLGLEAGLILFCLLLPLLFLHVFPALERLEAFGILEGFFLLISLLGGALVGAEYPLAVRIRLQESTSFGATAGLLNAADLAGGWWGGVLGAAALLPVLGMAGTFLALALLKAAGELSLLTHCGGRRRELQIRRS
jgi:spermidine synthase